MLYTDEAVNNILNYSKVFIDQINQKNSQKELKDILYLVFAGLASYYGFEYK